MGGPCCEFEGGQTMSNVCPQSRRESKGAKGESAVLVVK